MLSKMPCPFIELEATTFKDFIQWLVDNGGFNDLYIYTGYPVLARINGKIQKLINNSTTSYNLLPTARLVSKNDQVESIIISGEQVDCIYEHYDQNLRGVVHRFRVNIKGIRSFGGGDGMGITIRQISIQAPTVQQLKVEPEILEAFLPKNGMVIVSGPTGSGKSTLFASCLGHIAEVTGNDLVIGTCEAPIEYVFDHIDVKSVFIYQSSVAEIGGNLKNFESGVRASLRSGTTGTVIGELRDLETIRAALTASNTGQVVWGTLHVNSVLDMPSRIINVFPSDEMNKVRVEFYANSRFLMCQILVPSIVPGKARTPVKEWLKLTPAMRRELIACPLSDEAALLYRLLHEHGMPMQRYAKNLMDIGEISEETYQIICEGE